MNAAPHLREELPDHASHADHRGLAIDAVGIRGLRHPIVVWDRARGRQPTVAELALTVGLPAEAKGTHMSRFLEVLHGFQDELSLGTVPELLAEVRTRLDAASAGIEAEFDYFLDKAAPVSGARGLVDYRCRFDARLGPDGFSFLLGVTVPVTTLCPCSKAISAYGAHNQRGLVRVALRFQGMVWIEEVVEAVERVASSPVYAVLKREDEKFVTERAYERPLFVEDLVRDVVLALRGDALGPAGRVTWLDVEVRNQESIHNHDAVARITWSESPSAPTPAASWPPSSGEEVPAEVRFGAWLKSSRQARRTSQRHLAASLGVSPSWLSRVEAGAARLGEAQLDRLAQAWGLDAERLWLRAGVLPPRLAARVAADPDAVLASLGA